MRTRRPTRFVFAALAGALWLCGCASDDPYSAAEYAPAQNTRQPVVAPAGPLSPWWWPGPDSWWPFQ